MSRSCNHIRKLLAAFVDGELSQSDGREIDIHIGRCVSCRSYAETLWKQRELLVESLAPLAPVDFTWSEEAQSSREGSAILIVQRGEALVDHRPVHTNLVVDPGKRIDVPMGAVVHLHLSDGSFLYVESQSRLQVEKPGTERRISLEEGLMEADIVSGSTPFVVRTPAGELSLTSARFHVNVSASGVVQIQMESGWARFSNQHGDCRIYRDGSITVTHREAPPRAAPSTRKGMDVRRTLQEGRDRIPSPRRRPAEPRPFVTASPQRSRSPRQPQRYLYSGIAILVLALAGFIYLSVGRTWTQSQIITIADTLPPSEPPSEESAREMAALLRYLLWGQTQANEQPPFGREIRVSPDHAHIEISETARNLERAGVFLLSKYHPERLNLESLKNDLVYSVIVTVATGSDDLLDQLNRKALKARMARGLSDALGLRVDEQLRPFFEPHIACPPDSSGRIAVTARGDLIKQIPLLLKNMPVDLEAASLEDLYGADNAAFYYARLSRMAPEMIPSCTITLEQGLDPAWLTEASACIQTVSEALALLDEAARQSRCDFGLAPVSLALASDKENVDSLPRLPEMLMERASLRALWLARAGDSSQALDRLADLYKVSRDYRTVFGNVNAFLYSLELEEAAARAWRAFQVAEASPEVQLEALRRLENHRAKRAPVDIPELVRTAEYGVAPFRLGTTGPYQELVIADRLADARNRMLLAVTLLEESRRMTGVYPATLADATGLPAGLNLPMDPFAGTPFGYVSDGTACRIWSIGPDGIDQGGSIPYDPTNGIQSEGDLGNEQWTMGNRQ